MTLIKPVMKRKSFNRQIAAVTSLCVLLLPLTVDG